MSHFVSPLVSAFLFFGVITESCTAKLDYIYYLHCPSNSSPGLVIFFIILLIICVQRAVVSVSVNFLQLYIQPRCCLSWIFPSLPSVSCICYILIYMAGAYRYTGILQTPGWHHTILTNNGAARLLYQSQFNCRLDNHNFQIAAIQGSQFESIHLAYKLKTL